MRRGFWDLQYWYFPNRHEALGYPEGIWIGEHWVGVQLALQAAASEPLSGGDPHVRRGEDETDARGACRSAGMKEGRCREAAEVRQDVAAAVAFDARAQGVVLQ